MNWDDLRVFLALARNPHLRVAAKQVHLDATTVSRRISRLEDAISASLFEQYAGEHVLTDRGKELFAQAEKVEAAIVAARDQREGKVVSGRIRVSASEGFGLFIADHLHTFQDVYPDVLVDLVVSGGGRQNPSKREADIAISVVRPESGLVSIRKLVSPTTHLYASKAYLAKHGPITTIEEAAQHRLVGYIPDLLYTTAVEYLKDVLPDALPTIRCSSIVGQHLLIRQGGGIGMLPYFMAHGDEGLEQILPDIARASRDLWIIIHQDSRRMPRVHAFSRWLDQLVADNRHILSA